jgi:hypothetical protein
MFEYRSGCGPTTTIEMRIKTIIFAGAMVICCTFKAAQAQNRSETFTPTTVVRLGTCGDIRSHVAILKQYTEPQDLIIIVSHNGRGEKREMSRRRLHNARIFFSKGAGEGFNRSDGLIVTGEGDPVAGKGYIDFFVAGSAALRVFLEKNRDLALAYCVKEPEEEACSRELERLFFPCKARKAGRKAGGRRALLR